MTAARSVCCPSCLTLFNFELADVDVATVAPLPRPVGLTAQQTKLLEFIIDTRLNLRITPSYDEMMIHLGLRSKSGINRLIKGLESRGAVYRAPKRARSVIPVGPRP